MAEARTPRPALDAAAPLLGAASSNRVQRQREGEGDCDELAKEDGGGGSLCFGRIDKVIQMDSSFQHRLRKGLCPYLVGLSCFLSRQKLRRTEESNIMVFLQKKKKMVITMTRRKYFCSLCLLV